MRLNPGLEAFLLLVRVVTAMGLASGSSRIATASRRQIHGHSCIPRVQSETLIIETVVF